MNNFLPCTLSHAMHELPIDNGFFYSQLSAMGKY
jgi:hypothetical protein